MSWTPDQMVNKTAKGWKHFLYGVGGLCLFLAFAAFQAEGGEGTGLLLGLIGGGICWAASKIRTTYEKVAEGGVYRPR